MNKISHINITKRVSANIEGANRICLLLGSILPDIFVHTYIVGHKWNETFEKNCERLMRLEKFGCTGLYSFLKLGYVLHYIEDYFTYPHNTIYTEDMKAHVKYELDFYDYLKTVDNIRTNGSEEHLNAKQLCEWLEALHDEYMSVSVHNFESDYEYITKAAQKTVECMAAAFVKNEANGITFEGLHDTVIHREVPET